MGNFEQWQTRLRAMQEEGSLFEMHAFGVECLRLCLPMIEQPAAVGRLIRIAERYAESLAACTAATSPEEARRIRQANGYMADEERQVAIESGGQMARLATRIDWAYTFATMALNHLSLLMDARLESKLGGGSASLAAENLRRLYHRPGELSSLLHQHYPEAAKNLTALLDGAARSKTLDRLLVFRSFVIHGSFRKVAIEQPKQKGEALGTPDHTGPAYKVRKLGEALGIQLTRPSSGPGRAGTELTPAGEALSDWIRVHPDFLPLNPRPSVEN